MHKSQTRRVHDNSSKDTSSNMKISLQRQLVYYDSLSNATLSLLLFLPTTFGRKKCSSIITLRVHWDVIFGGMHDCNGIITVVTTKKCSIGLQVSIVK